MLVTGVCGRVRRHSRTQGGSLQAHLAQQHMGCLRNFSSMLFIRADCAQHSARISIRVGTTFVQSTVVTNGLLHGYAVSAIHMLSSGRYYKG